MKNFVTAGLACLAISAHALSIPRLSMRDDTVSPGPVPSGASAYPPVQAKIFTGSKFQPEALVNKEPLPTAMAQALYTMSNANGGENIIHAYALNYQGSAPNGMINTTATVRTYSDGLRFSQTGETLQDALDSQGSLIQAASFLFAVNAGSNTVQVWAINCSDPTLLVPLGKPVGVNGDNPTTIAVATANVVFCVATTGESTGVECYTYNTGFDKGEYESPSVYDQTVLPLPLPVAQDSNIPLGPADTVSELLFSDDEAYLVGIVKSQENSAGQVTNAGYIRVWPTQTDASLGTPVDSTPKGTELLFGCQFEYDTYNLFCADAGVGTVFLTFNATTLQYTTAHKVPTIDFGNGTNCWSDRGVFEQSPNYVSPVDKNYIAAFSTNNGDYYATTDFSTLGSGTPGVDNPQLISVQTASNYVYALSFGNADVTTQHILVSQDTNLKGSLNPLQNIKITGVTNSVDGLALFIPNSETGGDTSDTCVITAPS